AQIAGVDKRDPDALFAGRVDQRLAQLVAVTVEVMELADRGDPRLEHLTKNELGMLEVVGGIPLGVAIHPLAPLPEIAASRLDLPAQQALKGVAVRVGEPRHGPAFQDHSVVRRKRVLLDRADAAGLDLDQDVLGAVAEPGLLGVPLARTVQSETPG